MPRLKRSDRPSEDWLAWELAWELTELKEPLLDRDVSTLLADGVYDTSDRFSGLVGPESCCLLVCL